MPIYEYACTECGHRFEKRQKFSDEPVSECPECGSQVRRVLHPAGIIFKGSGWYITDSRKADNAASNGGSTSKADSATSASASPAAAED